jgi:hypothetical protein
MASASTRLSRASARRALLELEELRARFGDGSGPRKAELLAQLERADLATAKQVQRLHEIACFLRALPDDEDVLAAAERVLAGFERRRDLRRFRRELADTGIAGTSIAYPFFAPTARWLVERWGPRVRVSWAAFEEHERLEARLSLLASYSETPGLDEVALPLRRWIARLKGRGETDAQFLVRRHARLGVEGFQRDALYDELGLELELRAGPGTPSRTLAKLAGRGSGSVSGRPIAFRTRPLRRARPDLRREVRREPLEVVELSVRDGARAVELAREAMVTRGRDLDAFMHGDPHDVRLVRWEDGLELACIGVKPERRLMLEAVYGYLTLSNGVPIGYVLTSALMGSSEIAYNVFDTWRGGEAAHVYSRVLATTRFLFGSSAFTVYPYQLGGDGNTEGLKSGAWWFYQKLGFRPREPEIVALMEREVAANARDPRRRTDLATLARLAKGNMEWQPGKPRGDVIGVFPLHKVGLAITDSLAARFGSDRERGERVCAEEAARLCGVAVKGWTPDEKLAWTRWGPLILALPGVERWPAAERRSLAAVARAKGGRRESEFVRSFDSHPRLRAALKRLVRDVRDD